MTETAPAERVDLGVDLNADVPCGWKGPDAPCEIPAEYRATHPCCGFWVFLCHPHLLSGVRMIRRTPVVICKYCGAHPMPDPIWREI